MRQRRPGRHHDLTRRYDKQRVDINDDEHFDYIDKHVDDDDDIVDGHHSVNRCVW
jgi:hypothetical protein